MLNANFVILGLIINFFGNISYIRDTLQGKIKPNRVTFFLMPFAAFLAFAAEIKQGVGIESWIAFMSGLLPLTIFVASFVNKNAYWKIRAFDIYCGLLSFIGLLLWYITSVGNIAIMFGIIADGLALLPTIKKAWTNPETESAYPWLASSIAAIIALLSIQTWNFQTYAFPVYLILANSIVFLLVKYKIGKHIDYKKN